jgi:hypothetical protein
MQSHANCAEAMARRNLGIYVSKVFQLTMLVVIQAKMNKENHLQSSVPMAAETRAYRMSAMKREQAVDVGRLSAITGHWPLLDNTPKQTLAGASYFIMSMDDITPRPPRFSTCT